MSVLRRSYRPHEAGKDEVVEMLSQFGMVELDF